MKSRNYNLKGGEPDDDSEDSDGGEVTQAANVACGDGSGEWGAGGGDPKSPEEL